MKRLLSLAVALFIAALFSFSFVAVAQEPAVTPSPAGTTKKEPAAPIPNKPGVVYKRVRVLKGGNLADIAERCGYRRVLRISPSGARTYEEGWRPLYAVNQDSLPKVEMVGDMSRVLVHPGKILNLPVGWNYGTLDPEYVEPFPPASKETPSAEGTAREGVATASVTGGLLWLLYSDVWELILLIILILAALAVLAYTAMPLIRRRDPSQYQARIPGGLSANPETAARQLAIAYPGRRYVQIRRCRLVRHHGPRHVRARRMDFGDGRVRDVNLNDGDLFYRGITAEGVVDNFLTGCGNYYNQEGVEIPDGWEVRIIDSHDIGPTVYGPPMTASSATATASTSAAPAPAPAPVPAPAPAPVSEPAPAPEPESEPAMEPTPEAESPAVTAEVEETIKQTLTHNEVEVTVDGLLIKVVGKNGEIPATEIRTGGGAKVTIQQP